MSRLTLQSWEIEEAISSYVKEHYGIELDKVMDRSCCYPSFKYIKPIYAYEKHKNGKHIKDKHGFRSIDWDKTEFITKHVEFNDDSEITFYLERGE